MAAAVAADRCEVQGMDIRMKQAGSLSQPNMLSESAPN